MTFGEALHKIDGKQVDDWWENIAPDQAPQSALNANWKYHLFKNGKRLPFKWAVKSLIQSILNEEVRIVSDENTRFRFCQQYGFEIQEDQEYDQPDLERLQAYYDSGIQQKVLFNSALKYLHDIVQQHQLNTYHIRAAISSSAKCMLVIGMRAVFSYLDKTFEQAAEISLILEQSFIDSYQGSNSYTEIEQFEGKGSKCLVSYELSSFDTLDKAIQENHIKCFLEEYESVKDKKVSQWNAEAKTTSHALKAAIVNQLDIRNMQISIPSQGFPLQTAFEKFKSKHDFVKWDKYKTLKKYLDIMQQIRQHAKNGKYTSYQELNSDYQSLSNSSDDFLDRYFFMVDNGISDTESQYILQVNQNSIRETLEANVSSLIELLTHESPNSLPKKIGSFLRQGSGNILGRTIRTLFPNDIAPLDNPQNFNSFTHCIDQKHGTQLVAINSIERRNQLLKMVQYQDVYKAHLFFEYLFEDFLAQELMEDLLFFELHIQYLISCEYRPSTISSYSATAQKEIRERWKKQFGDEFYHFKLELENLLMIDKITQKSFSGVMSFSGFLDQLISHYQNPKDNMNPSSFPLNQILYGPPGTGKTYHTIDKAVQIVTPEVYNPTDHDSNKQHFDELVKEGRIVFSTFHQSMGYEDFIEGIKPNSDGENIEYNIEAGIFKKICSRASSSGITKDNFNEVYQQLLDIVESSGGAMIFETPKLSREFTIKVNSKKNLRFHANTEKAFPGVIKKEFLESYLKTGDTIDWPSYTAPVGDYMKEELGFKIGDTNSKQRFVLIIDEINRGNIAAIFGELITLLEENKRAGNKEALELTLPYSKKPFSVPNNLYIIGTMNTADRSVEALDSALRRRFSFQEMMPQPKLLSPEQMVVNLWNHPDYFEAPWNDKSYRKKADHLYTFLGIDKAFEESYKDSKYKDGAWTVEMLEKLDFKGINLEQILNTINERIEVLIDRDHSIGHSYFMGLETKENIEKAVKLIFKDKIIPLLQEYFFNDYGKIQLILGKGFVSHTEAENIQFATTGNEHLIESDYNDRLLYSLTPIDEHFDLPIALNHLFGKKRDEQ